MILIAVDNPEMRRTLKEMLREIDTQFCECENGRQAVELYPVCKPDWVLMDVKMPEMGGIEATRVIKGSFPGARILIVTNYDDPLLRQEATSAGAAGFVLKDDLSVLESFIAKSQI